MKQTFHNYSTLSITAPCRCFIIGYVCVLHEEMHIFDLRHVKKIEFKVCTSVQTTWHNAHWNNNACTQSFITSFIEYHPKSGVKEYEMLSNVSKRANTVLSELRTFYLTLPNVVVQIQHYLHIPIKPVTLPLQNL